MEIVPGTDERPRAPRHQRLSRNGLAWLAFLSDPGATRVHPARPLEPAEAAALIEAATLHGVLPNVVRRLRAMPEAWGNREAPREVADASETLIALAATSLRLGALAGRVLAALAAASVPSAVVKGPVFAKWLYPDPVLRPFGDIDIVVASDGLPASRRVLAGLGLIAYQEPKRVGHDYHEEQWILRGPPDLLVEIQDDLVHSPSIAGRMTLGLNELRAAGRGDPEAATALLLAAAVHGAVGHQFDRLRYCIDLCQAARGAAGPIEVPLLDEVARRSNVLLPLLAGLDLGARALDEPAARRLADQLAKGFSRRIFRVLWSPTIVLRAQGPQRPRDSWRRQAGREIFKRLLPAGG